MLLTCIFATHAQTHTHTHTHRIKSSLKKLSWKRIHFWFGKFPTVEDLLDHFESKPVIGGESGASVDTRYLPSNIYAL